MLRRIKFRVILIMILTLGLELTLAGAGTTIGAIKNGLICTCDCSMTVEACEGSMACEAAAKLTDQAQRLIGAGLNQEAILASFVARYGETILAAPTKEGFNLLAWVMPFLVLIIATLTLVKMLRHWARVNVDSLPAQQVTSKLAAKSGDYEKLLNEVLNTMD